MTAPGSGFLHHAAHNGVLTAASTLRAALPNPGFAERDGVFETVRVLGSRPVGLAEHEARLAGALGVLGAAASGSLSRPIPSDQADGALGTTRPTFAAGGKGLAERCAAVIAANGLVDGSLKIAVYRSAGGWAETILARPPAYAPAQYTAGFRLQTVPCDQWTDPLHGLKSLHRPHHQAARAAAAAAGFDEALWIDPRGLVLEGAVTNIFVVREGRVVTPALSAGILPGVMRARVLCLASPPARSERDLGIVELRQADEVFVTNALLGIMPVAQVDDITFDLGSSPITRSLMAALAERMESLRA
jgi:branched-subunit amino acid aminotransferase/4-amino-4-deoxychorismate lyase